MRLEICLSIQSPHVMCDRLVVARWAPLDCSGGSLKSTGLRCGQKHLNVLTPTPIHSDTRSSHPDADNCFSRVNALGLITLVVQKAETMVLEHSRGKIRQVSTNFLL